VDTDCVDWQHFSRDDRPDGITRRKNFDAFLSVPLAVQGADMLADDPGNVPPVSGPDHALLRDSGVTLAVNPGARTGSGGCPGSRRESRPATTGSSPWTEPASAVRSSGSVRQRVLKTRCCPRRGKAQLFPVLFGGSAVGVGMRLAEVVFPAA